MVKNTPQQSFFNVNSKNGFLPVEDTLFSLPAPFTVVSDLMNNAPLIKKDGSPGLLSYSDDQLQQGIVNLPNLITQVEYCISAADTVLIQSLYRNYVF